MPRPISSRITRLRGLAWARIAAVADAPEAGPDPLRAALDEVEADGLSPRDALELVYRLKRLQAESG